MALIPCKECNKEIGSTAKKCPHCGTDQRNWFGRNKILTILGVIVISFVGLAIIGAMLPDEKSETVSKNQVIEAKSVGNIKLDMTYKDVLSSYNEYMYEMSNFDFTYEKGLIIKNNNGDKIIAFMSNAKEPHDNKNKIYEIAVFSKDFKTKNGIYPSMSINELLKIYPNMNIERNDFGEYFTPSDYKNSDISMEIKLISNDKDKELGSYESCGIGCSKPTTKFSKDGKISAIIILGINKNIEIEEVNQPVMSQEDEQMIELIKKGTLPSYDYANISKVFEASFDEGIWTTEETKKGKRIVKFSGKISQNLHETAIKELKSTYETGKNDFQTRVNLLALAMATITGKKYEILMETKGNEFFDSLDKKLNCNGFVYQNATIPYPNCKNEKNSNIYLEKSIEEMFIRFWQVGDPVEVEWTISADRNSFEVSSMNSKSWAGITFNKIIETIYKE